MIYDKCLKFKTTKQNYLPLKTTFATVASVGGSENN